MTNLSTNIITRWLCIFLGTSAASCGDRAFTEPPPPDGTCEPTPLAKPLAGMAQWSQPERLDIPIVEKPVHPQIATSNGTVYVAFNGQRTDEGERFPIPTDVYVLENAGSEWSVPYNISNTVSPSLKPRLSVDSNGVLHVVWGERIGGDPEAPPLSATSILYSSKQQGRWTTPDTVWIANDEDIQIPWRPVSDAAGGVHLAFTPGGVARRDGAVHLRKTGVSWSRMPNFSGFSVDLINAGDSLLIAASIYGDARGGEGYFDSNSVFISYSRDGGVNWTPYLRVLRAGSYRAYYPRVVAGGDGRIHLIWLRQGADGTYPDRLEHSYSPDGKCWSKPTVITPALPGMPYDAQVVADDAGGLHLVYHRSAGGMLAGPFQAVYVYWDGVRWQEPQPLFGTNDVGQSIGLDRDASGNLHLAISAEINGQGGIYYAVGRTDATH